MRSARAGAVHNAAAIQHQKYPVAGKIRPGIKVITKKAAEIQEVRRAYDEGLAAGASFDDIERAMKAASKACPGYPLAPRNVPYFRVHQGDFSVPGAARRILELYGEKREGDSEPQLYAFPVVFPSDDIDLVFREQFEAWSASQLLRWSEADPQTGELCCMRRQELTPDKSKRRRFGGRPTEKVGPCEPNSCDLFAAGQCQHIGSLYFWVPGITGAGVIELEFRSIYASMGVMETLELIKGGLGRIKGLIGGQPIFTISKSSQNVSVIDWEAGKAGRQEQQIIRLEATGLDMTAVMASQEAPMLPAPQAREPRLLVSGPGELVNDVVGGVDLDTGEVIDAAAEEPASEGAGEGGEEQPQGEAAAMAQVVARLRAELSTLAKTLGWKPEELGAWIKEHYGADAAHNAEKLDLMIEALNEKIAAVDNPGKAPF